jgi:histone H3/H4
MSNRKILRDNIQAITSNAVKRLARRAGVKRISSLVYEETRGITRVFLEDVLRSVIVRVGFTKSKTIKVKHVEPSLDVAMYSAAISDFKCHARKRAEKKEGSKRRHHNPGTVALSDIRHYQKGGCLMISRAAFNRVVREIAHYFNNDLRLSTDAALLLQYATESHLVHLFEGANTAALHAGRTGIQPKDLQFVRHLGSGVKVLPTSSNVPVINFNVSIDRVLGNVHPDSGLGIGSDAKSQVNFLVNKFASAVINTASELAELNNQTTLDIRVVQAAVTEVLPDELARHAVSEGTKAVGKFKAHKVDKSKKTSGAKKAGLLFSVSKVRTLLKDCATLQKVHQKAGEDDKRRTILVKKGCDRRVGAGASVYLAAVLEYITAEILDLSGNSARDHKHVRITARDLTLAIDNDQALTELRKKLNVEIIGGGVLPHIHTKLLPVKKVKL